MMSPKEAIGQALKRVRLDAKKTQSEIGEALGVSQVQVSKLETGASDVTVWQVFKWAVECGVTFDSVSLKIQHKVVWG